jgi:hypothetical protein
VVVVVDVLVVVVVGIVVDILVFVVIVVVDILVVVIGIVVVDVGIVVDVVVKVEVVVGGNVSGALEEDLGIVDVVVSETGSTEVVPIVVITSGSSRL